MMKLLLDTAETSLKNLEGAEQRLSQRNSIGDNHGWAGFLVRKVFYL